MDALAPLAREQADLVDLLDRRAVLGGALELLAADGDVAWVAEPAAGSIGGGGDPDYLVLAQVRGDRTGLLRGLRVSPGLGLTGKVHSSGNPSWVDDYLHATEITHTFDQQIEAEAVRRLLAVPVRRDGQVLGVLALGARSDGVFGGRELARVRSVADRAALAVAVAERARLAREVAVHEERSRVAAELHDSVGALLFAIGSGLACLAETAAGDPELAARTERLRRQAADASTALRDSLRALRVSPAALALSVALRTDCTAFTDRSGIPAELVVLDDDPPELSPARTEVLVTAVREALLNVEKHARASAVVVTAGRRPAGGVVVAVIDDGVGLASGHVRGLGLTSTADAVGRLGGVLRLNSDAGGVTWRIELPW